MKKDPEVEKFLDALRDQIAITCRIHKCDLKEMPKPLWDFTLDAACLTGNVKFKEREGASKGA